MIHEVYPYSFAEYLKASGIDVKAKNALYAYAKDIVRLSNIYFQHGGLPETVGMKEPRSWMSNLFSKIFFGDLVARYKIRNDFALRVMIRKMAESVKQPLSYSRIASIVSSTGKKLSTDATIDYVATWLTPGSFCRMRICSESCRTRNPTASIILRTMVCFIFFL